MNDKIVCRTAPPTPCLLTTASHQARQGSSLVTDPPCAKSTHFPTSFSIALFFKPMLGFKKKICLEGANMRLLCVNFFPFVVQLFRHGSLLMSPFENTGLEYSGNVTHNFLMHFRDESVTVM